MRALPNTAPTIAAIATPPGRGGIGIVRVSGNELDALIEGVAGRALAPRVATRVTFRDAHGAPIDSGLALYFPRPHSYTGEDVVEWHGHGGPAVMRLLLARCVELGARLAEPGEFTKRAFLNGKLDLAQAESVADVIEAATATAVRAAARSLTGEFSREVHALTDALIDLRMYTEATLDFPEEDLDLLREGDVAKRLAAIRERLARVLERARSGAILRTGLTVVLVGAPNVGKSSLLNRLVGEDAAIVTPIPGTTRDTVERQVEIGGIPLTVIDTAGLRDTEDTVELLGIARTRAAIERADVALVLVDARDDADRDDIGAPRANVDAAAAHDAAGLVTMERVSAHAVDPNATAAMAALVAEVPATLPRIIVHNKCDLALLAPHLETYALPGDAVVDRALPSDAVADRAGGTATHIWLCALTGDGVALLEAEVMRIAGVEHAVEDAFFARERQLAALAEGKQHLDAAATHVATAPPPLELFAEELRMAQQAFSSITGEFTADDLLGEIFSRFCIGK